MSKKRAAPQNWLFYALTVLLVAVSIGVLWHLLTRFERDLDANLERLQKVFADENLLKNPGDPNVNFGTLEELAEKYRGYQYLRSMTITKFFGATEHVVYPFFFPALFVERESKARSASTQKKDESASTYRQHPLPWNPPADTVRLALTARGHLLGYLYARVDRGPLRSVQAAIALLTLLLFMATGLFVLQFRRQESVISRTTIELEEKRRELIRLERLALAGQLSANILHDLKKPVLNIKNELEELELTAESAAQRHFAQRLREQVTVFFSILREGNLERFARGEGEREWLDVNEIIARSIALVRYERGNVAHELALEPALPPVFGVPVRMIQVFSNLILNAYQAMGGTGTLNICTHCVGSRVLVEISDTGPGIPEEDLDKIFTPFYSTKPADSGTGLGLYITRDIIEEMGGTIRVTSGNGGTTFTIELPTE